MEEIEAILKSESEKPLENVLRWLKKMHVKYSFISSQESRDFFNSMNSFVKDRFKYYSLPEKHSIEIALRTFLTLLGIDPSVLDLEILDNTDLEIKQIYMHSLLQTQADQEMITKTTKICQITLYQMQQAEERSFFSTPPWFYTRDAFHILHSNVNIKLFIDLLGVTPELIENIFSKSSPNYSTLTYLSDLYRMIMTPFQQDEHQYMLDLLKTFTVIFSSNNYPPSILISLFFQTWYVLVSKVNQIAPGEASKITADQYEKVTKLFEKISGTHYHDLHYSFQWAYVIAFYMDVKTEEQRNRILLTLCSAIRKVSDIDQTIQSKVYREVFLKSLGDTFATDQSPFFLLMKHIIDTISSTILQLDKLHSLNLNTDTSIFGPIDPDKIYLHQSTFHEQNQKQCQYDMFDVILTTKFKNVYISDIHKYMIELENLIRIWETSKKRFQTTLSFLKPMGSFFMQIAKNTTNPLHRIFVKHIARIFIRIVIYCCHSHMIIHRYLLSTKFQKEEIPLNLIQILQNNHKTSDINLLLAFLFDIIEIVPQQYFDDCIETIVEELFIANKEEKLTLNLIKFFDFLLNHSNSNQPQSQASQASQAMQNQMPQYPNQMGMQQPQQPQPRTQSKLEIRQNIITKILQAMVAKVPSLMKTLFSVDASKSTFVIQWILFSIRLGFSTNLLYKSSPFMLSLVSVSRMITSGLIAHIRRPVIVKHLWMLIEAMITTFQIIAPNSDANVSNNKLKIIRPRLPLTEDVFRTSYLYATQQLCEYLGYSLNAPQVQYYIPMLENTFATHDNKCILSATNFATKLIDKSIDEFIKPKSESVLSVPRLLFKNLSKMNEDNALKCLKNTPYFSQEYLTPQRPLIRDYCTLRFRESKFNIEEIVTSIIEMTSVTKEEMLHALNLVTIAFEQIIEEENEQHLCNEKQQLKNLMSKLLTLFNSIYAYSELKTQTNKLNDHLILEFGNLFIIGKSNIFLITLFETIGLFKCEMYLPLVHLAKKLITYIGQETSKLPSRYPIDQYVLHTIEDIFKYGNIKTQHNTLLTAFSFFIQQFPHIFNIMHIKLLLSVSTEVPYMDEYSPNLFFAFLTEYLNHQDDRGKDEFLYTIYSSATAINSTIRHSLNKVIINLHRPIQSLSIPDLERSSLPVFYHKFTIAVFSGTLTTATNMIITKIEEFLNTYDDRMPFEKMAKKVTISWAVTFCPAIYQMFSRDPQSTQVIYSNLGSAFGSRSKLIREIVETSLSSLMSNNYSDSKLASQFADVSIPPQNYSQRLLNPSLAPPILDERIMFNKRRRLKLFPDKCPPEFAENCCSTIFEYEAKPIEEKLKMFNLFRETLKTLSVKGFINRQDTKSVLLKQISQNSTIYRNLIISLINIYNTTTLSENPIIQLSMKHILQIFQALPLNTIELIVFKDDFPGGMNFLYEIMLMDNELILFNSILELMKKLSTEELLNLKSSAFKILHDLTDQGQKYITRDLFDVINACFVTMFNYCYNIKNIHNNIYDSFSEVCYILINVYYHNPEPAKIFKFCQVFYLLYFSKSDVFYTFARKLFCEKNKDMVLKMLDVFHKNFEKIKPNQLDILLQYCIKNMPTHIFTENSELSSKLWDMMYNNINDRAKSYAVFHSMIPLFKKARPPEEYMPKILEAAIQSVSQSNSATLVYSLKFLKLLAENNLLPAPCFYQLFEHIFYNGQLFEVPYAKSVINLLRSSTNFIDNLPPKCIDALMIYSHNHLSKPRELKRFGTVLTSVPNIRKYLPYSFVSVASICIQKAMAQQDFKDIVQLYRLLNNLGKSLTIYVPLFFKKDKQEHDGLEEKQENPNEDHSNTEQIISEQMVDESVQDPELQDLILRGDESKTNCQIALQLLKNPNLQKPEIMIIFATYILDNCTEEIFPEDYIGTVNLPLNNFTFCLSCLGVIFQKGKFILNNEKAVEQCLQYQNQDFHKFTKFYEQFINTLFSSRSTFIPVKHIILPYFDYLLINFITLYERVFLFATNLLACTYDNTSTEVQLKLESFFNEQPKSKTEATLKFVLMLDLLPYIPNGNQIYFINSFVAPNFQKEIFISNVSDLISDDKVSPESKKRIILLLVENEVIIDSDYPIYNNIIQNCLDYADKFHVDFTIEIIHLLFLCSYTRAFPIRVNSIQQIIYLLPESKEERIQFLVENIHPNFWKDPYLPLISMLLCDQTKEWFSLASLVLVLERTNSSMIQTQFDEILNQEFYNPFLELLINILGIDDKKPYTNIITALIRAFYNKSVKIPFEIAAKAIKFTNDKFILPFFYDTDSLPSFQHIKHNIDQNDELFAYYDHDHDIKNKAIAALLQLNQFESAQILFDTQPNDVDSDFMKILRTITTRFTIDSSGPPSLQKLLLPLKKTESLSDKTLEGIAKGLVFVRKHQNPMQQQSMQMQPGFQAQSPQQQQNQKDLISNTIADVYKGILKTLRSKERMSRFETERAVVIASVCDFLSKRLQTPPYQPFNYKKIDFSYSVNPTFQNTYNNILSFGCPTLDKPKKQIQTMNDSPTLLHLQPSFLNELQTFIGTTTRGLIAIGMEQINQYFSIINSRIRDKRMTDSNWYTFGMFVYNVFTLQQTDELFQATYNAFAKVIQNNSQDKVQNLSSSTRIIFLISLAIKQGNREFVNAIKENNLLFETSNIILWRTWIQHLVIFSRESWFFDICKSLFIDFPQRTLATAQRLQCRDLVDFLRMKWGEDRPQNQNQTIQLIDTYFNMIFDHDFYAIERFQVLQSFVKSIRTLAKSFTSPHPSAEYESFEAIDFNEILSKYSSPSTDFEQNCMNLLSNEIEMIGNFAEFANIVSSLSDEEVNPFIITHFQLNVTEDLLTKISDVLMEFNSNMSLSLQKRNERNNNQHIIFYYIHPFIKYINKNTVLIKATTSTHVSMSIYIERFDKTDTKGNYSLQMETNTNYGYTIQSLLNSCYQTRIRSMSISSREFLEVGHNISMTPFLVDFRPLSHYFRRSTKINEQMLSEDSDFIREHMEQTEQMMQGQYMDEENQLIDDVLLKNIMAHAKDPFNFVNFKKMFMRSYAVNAVNTTMLSIPYPEMINILICDNATSISTYAISSINSSNYENDSHFRLSPNIVTLFGRDIFEDEFATLMSCSAKCFVENMEVIRANLELLLTDTFQELPTDFDNLISERINIENRVLDLAPPDARNTNEEDCIEWYQNIINLIEKAKSPQQDPMSIPWF